MNEELKAMLEGLTTDELKEVQTVVNDLIAIAEESKDEDGQPDEMKEQSDFAKDDTVPYEEDDRPF
jgi:hypothetical protein